MPQAVTGLDPLIAVLVVTIAISVTAAILAWNERPEPGARPLTALLIGAIWWSAFLAFDLQSSTLATKLMWARPRWIGVVIIPVAWLWFALEYTGRDEFVQSRYIAGLSAIPAITVIFAVTNDYHGLLYADAVLVEESGRVLLERTPGPWFWVIAGYTYLLGVFGAIPLLGLITSDAMPFRGQSIAILIGIITPWSINILFLAGAFPIPGLDPTPIGFAVSGVAYLGAITRFRLFETNPAPKQTARRLVFEQMQDGAIVVDNHDYIIDVNETAPAILGAPPQELLAQPAHEVIPKYADLLESRESTEQVTLQTENGQGYYDLTVTPIENIYGRVIGRLIVFHDVGEHLRQQQRLEVLNRVLRHNIRNEVTIISGNAEILAESNGNSKLDAIRERATRIETMAEKARTISDVMERDADEFTAVPLDSILEDSLAVIADEFPSVSIEYTPLPDRIWVADVLELVFTDVIRNAAEHNTSTDPWVRVSAEVDDEHDRVRVAVADNGPGIPESERAVLEGGTETPLAHGSGLGLWLINWVTSIANGEVTFQENSPAGSVVTVQAPVLSRSRSEDRTPKEVSA